MGSLAMVSMLGSLLMVLIVGAVLLFVIVQVTRATAGAGAAVGQMTDPVPGTLLVTASAMPSRRALFHMTRITGVISADGIEAVAVQFSGLIRTSKWPSPGETLPVTVDRADPQRFAIEWDRMANSGEQALSQAEAIADAMRRGRND